MDLSFILMLSLIRFQKCFELYSALAIPVTHVPPFGRNVLGPGFFARIRRCVCGMLGNRVAELSLFGYR